MKAMVLAAGLGTRLRPLTNDRPKALVELGGQTYLGMTLERLKQFGVHDVIVNIHHFADMIVDYLAANDHFGMHIEVSREDELLDTGGGLKNARWFFDDEAPFVLHNVDVLTTIDVGCMLKFHVQHNPLATLAVQDRHTSRYLLFDEQSQLCGRSPVPSETPKSLAFSGIHIISPRLLKLMNEDGAFSIITTYLRLAGEGERIMAFRADEYQWRDLGKLENLSQAGPMTPTDH